ncbi:divergent polysaccharide deacetylase family protein [Clostridium algidicarnis]|uniref:divergent polysaccharide deacetylase family protein n=1 Tax=Clostridium algidicarnis TaxID=37659 RepID=UPI0004973EAB|nr:divergent polysaccharide deacetylase family protein [Clostridium algidicarnis]MBU3195142.1 divergent polysaccharide deacetylase family protein [Clostridium algidicarnis]MBU3208098.1 divergent polysaccharide deacetylase family protein [Clostridium algidicarnis]MBU3227671.1 divergent polysaccharide deacetylase family protein [Clostridium algidicarnis]MBU3250922.1 divergent polysaccharide deacetylase family protein [Clostridium algidicarnis]
MFIVIKKKQIIVALIIIIICIISVFGIIYLKGENTFNETYTYYVAIVIDDFGNDSKGTKEMMDIGIPFTAAIMPFMSSSVKDSQKAKEKGIETIVHLPMEPEIGKASWLGPRGITVNLEDAEINTRVEEAFKEIDGAVGLNNHMGSKAMKDERVVGIIMECLKKNNKIFLDSKTTSSNIAENIAKNLDVKYYGRNIFLDNNKDISSIEKQLDKVADLAIKEGKAIAIGHVGVEGGEVTAKAIKNKTKELERRGIEFVPLSQMP